MVMIEDAKPTNPTLENKMQTSVTPKKMRNRSFPRRKLGALIKNKEKALKKRDKDLGLCPICGRKKEKCQCN
jgi:hypothetical protein